MLNVPAGRTLSEQVHVHSGQCGNDTLGGIVHSLTDVNPSGTSATTWGVSLSNLKTGNFAINSHKRGEPTVYTTCGNIPKTGSN